MKNQYPNARQFQLEQLERREVPATGIALDPANGVLNIEGSTTNDAVRVQYAFANGSLDRSRIQVTLQTDFGFQADGEFNTASVSLIQFQGKRGTDLFDNNTAVPSTTSSWTGGTINTSLLLGSPGNASPEQTGQVGVFTVGTTGAVQVDYLYKGAGYRGELGFFSLQGMSGYTPGSADYIKEAARRARSESLLGHVVIRAQSQGARFTANLPWEGNLNSGTYVGPQKFAMTPGDSFGAMLVPNGTIQDVFNNPAVGGDKRPLFSIPEANPYVITPQMRGQAGDLDGHGSMFAFEDLRLDGASDRDYNDMVFQVTGARGVGTPVAEVINSSRDFTKTSIGQTLLSYGLARESSDTTTSPGAGTAGVFTVGSTGQLGVDFLFDGGGYTGELAVFSLQGMSGLTPGSAEFIREAARRAMSDSVLGHVLISDKSEGARTAARLAWESDFNQGIYQGVKQFSMTPGDTVAFMLVPNASVWEVFNNPASTGNKLPLFSLAAANPVGAYGSTQMADLTGKGSTFGFEDQRQDGTCDRDYNDMVFRVSGLNGWAASMASVVNASKNLLLQEVANAILAS